MLVVPKLVTPLTRLAAFLLICWAGIGCTSPPPMEPVVPHDTFTLESTEIGELRRLNVYMPPGYEEGGPSYPVLYMPDGGIEEDFPHIARTVDILIREKEIAPILVVGIENTVRRRDLNGPTTNPRDLELAPQAGGSNNFRAFIRSELIPEIERRYRVTDQRAIVGESAAGSFVVETFFLEPTLFSRYMAMDPALYWNDRELVRRAEERLGRMDDLDLTLWLTAGDTPEIMPATEALAAELKAHAPANLRWTYDLRMDETHQTIFRATKKDAFRSVLWKAQNEENEVPGT